MEVALRSLEGEPAVDVANVIGRALAIRDPRTGAHIARIGSAAAVLARELGLDPDRSAMIEAAAPLHDIGKIAIPDRILRKPGRLTGSERRIMENHTLIGHRMLSGTGSAALDLAAVIALGHHERVDGSGYPGGVTGGDIPLEARIVAVVDVFDALINERSYRPAMPVARALELMEGGRGSQFDPQVLDTFLDCRLRLGPSAKRLVTFD